MISIKSVAKLNLFLEITEKRPDGYHNLDSIFSLINLSDDIKIEFTKNGEINVATDHPEVPDGEKNIIYKTVLRIKELKRIKSGVNIFVTKNIPVGGGLGGGSSNAAAVISCLSKQWGFDAKSEEILDLAKQIGADVPFFLHDARMARCEGIGETVTPLEEIPELWFVLVNPGLNINTGEVYRSLNLTKEKKDSKIIMDAIYRKDLAKIADNFYNRLEEPVLKRYPVIADIKKVLMDYGCIGSLMSGSGSTVFGLVENEHQGKNLLKLIKENYKNYFLRLVKSEMEICERKSNSEEVVA